MPDEQQPVTPEPSSTEQAKGTDQATEEEKQEEAQPTLGPSGDIAQEAPTEPGVPAEGEDATTVPNELQQPTPAGADYAQEGGPTVADQAANAAANEQAKQKEQEGEE